MSEITVKQRVNIDLTGTDREKFQRIKEYSGILADTEVIRYAINSCVRNEIDKKN